MIPVRAAARLLTLLAPLVSSIFVIGCAHRPGVPGSAASSAAAGAARAASTTPLLEVAGVWEWVLRGGDGQGNLRVEQEEWHLTQDGRRLEGFYDRAVTVVSLDDRLFRCNRKLGFTRLVRVRVAGEIEGDRVRLQEIAYDARPGPCEDGARSLARYEGQMVDRSLRLRFGDEGRQTLHRRDADAPDLRSVVDQAGPAGLAERERGAARRGDPPPPSSPSGPAASRASLPVAGAWRWELRSIDAEGDERVEDEQWQLRETPEGITGHYDRRVRRERARGTYACNQSGTQEQLTRYEVSGHRLGESLVLTEVSYSADKSPCDNGVRRLDTYQGSLTLDGDELILSWGSGHQVLRRPKPDDAPTRESN